MICKYCIYFEQLPSNEGKGNCKRFPPTVAPTGSKSYEYVSRYPVVTHYNTCGEYKVKK